VLSKKFIQINPIFLQRASILILMSKKILVTGGCGYIGSHTIVDLIEKGFQVVCLDNLSNADESALEGIRSITGKQVTNYKVDLCDSKTLSKVFEEHLDLAGIIHFAALKSVGDSVFDPLLYYQNNITGLINLLECAQTYRVRHFIFSSSCSVYGNSDELPVTEQTPLKEAESPYARTKQMGEAIIRDYVRVNPNFDAIILRYFNPAGAHLSAIIGESPTNPANNLVPVITETAIGKRKEMIVFGDDYDTRDGSCIRDFIHVMDLADAHSKALQYILADANDTNFEVFNLGTGDGISVLEAIRAFENVNDIKLNYRIGPRREGDVIAVYADRSLAHQKLGWEPQYSIESIMLSAWKWEQRRSQKVTADTLVNG
jgi:UDP-glucose 4-epimerase